MSEDRIVDDYLDGKLPFSAIYREASREDACPDELAARVCARAARRQALWPAVDAARRWRRHARSAVERHPFLAGGALAAVAAVLWIAALNLRSGDDSVTGPVLECPGPSTGEGAVTDDASGPRARGLTK